MFNAYFCQHGEILHRNMCSVAGLVFRNLRIHRRTPVRLSGFEQCVPASSWGDILDALTETKVFMDIGE